MCSLYHSVCSLVVVRDKDYLDVQGALEVGPELGHEGIAIVRTGRFRKAVPLHPAVEKGMTAGL